MKPLKDIDYVEIYAEKLREDNNLFVQQKKLIESQMHGSLSLFKKRCTKSNFKEIAREYLKGIGLIR